MKYKPSNWGYFRSSLQKNSSIFGVLRNAMHISWKNAIRIFMHLISCLLTLIALQTNSHSNPQTSIDKHCPQNGQVFSKPASNIEGATSGWKSAGIIGLWDPLKKFKKENFDVEFIYRETRFTTQYCILLTETKNGLNLVKDSLDISNSYPLKKPIRYLKTEKTDVGHCYPLQEGRFVDLKSENWIIGIALRDSRANGFHYSNRVTDAWRIDFTREKFIPITDDNLVCHIGLDAGEGYYDCNKYRDGIICK